MYVYAYKGFQNNAGWTNKINRLVTQWTAKQACIHGTFDPYCWQIEKNITFFEDTPPKTPQKKIYRL